jgi:hypothetical protein
MVSQKPYKLKSKYKSGLFCPEAVCVGIIIVTCTCVCRYGPGKKDWYVNRQLCAYNFKSQTLFFCFFSKAPRHHPTFEPLPCKFFFYFPAFNTMYFHIKIYVMPWLLGAVDIASASGTKRPGFESRQDVRFLAVLLRIKWLNMPILFVCWKQK